MTLIEHAVLARLCEDIDGLTAARLAGQIWPCPSATRHQTLRRALGSLQRAGLADVFTIGPRQQVAASITPAGFLAARG